MFRLTREVRFALLEPGSDPARNGHAGYPTLARLAPWGALRVTLAGELDSSSGYLRNIKEIDQMVRARAVPMLLREHSSPVAALPAKLAATLCDAWPGASLQEIQYLLSPYLSAGCIVSELPMVRISQKFEFSAAHRLHNDSLSAEENRKLFGKCNNPHGHGHNYEVQITLLGKPDPSGRLIAIGEFERIVDEVVIQPLDHKYLNVEVPEFASLNPSVENIAMVIYRRLQSRFTGAAKLSSVTVWETPRTWSEYSE